MRHTFLAALISISLLMAQARPCPARQAGGQAPAQAAPTLDQHALKMKREVEKLGVGELLTAVLKGGKEYHGTIARVEAGSFQLAEVDLKQIVTIRYDEMKKLYHGYAPKDLHIGRNPRRNMIVASALAVGGLIVLGTLRRGD